MNDVIAVGSRSVVLSVVLFSSFLVDDVTHNTPHSGTQPGGSIRSAHSYNPSGSEDCDGESH